MKKRLLYIVLVLAAISGFYACGYYNCQASPGLRIGTIGLTAAEIDTIILRKYTKGSGFTNRIDTLQIDSSNALFQFPFAGKDTSFMGVFSMDALLKSNYDYEIFIPAVNKLVKITGIYEPQQKMKRTLTSDKTACVDIIQSFQQDGITVTLSPQWPEHIYIHR